MLGLGKKLTCTSKHLPHFLGYTKFSRLALFWGFIYVDQGLKCNLALKQFSTSDLRGGDSAGVLKLIFIKLILYVAEPP
jgi:hypothetical protein